MPDSQRTDGYCQNCGRMGWDIQDGYCLPCHLKLINTIVAGTIPATTGVVSKEAKSSEEETALQRLKTLLAIINQDNGRLQDEVGLDIAYAEAERKVLKLLTLAILKEKQALDEYYRWRPIEELHEDDGDCVLINLNDPGSMVVESCLTIGHESSLWTHFTRVTPLTYEVVKKLLSEKQP